METDKLILSSTPKKTNQCNKILIASVIFLVITNITTIILAVTTEVFKECSTIETVNFESPNIEIPDGNQFEFDTTVCEGYRQLWEDPSIELSERNKIGRAIFQTPAKLQQAISLIKMGKRYDLGREYTQDMGFFPGRYLSTQLYCSAGDRTGGCTQGVDTNAMGNIGTQFDYFTHFYLVDTNKSDQSDFGSNNDYIVLWNNFKGSDVFTNYSGNGDSPGGQYLSADKLPMFFTKAILIDIAGYKEKDILDLYYVITTTDFLGAMDKQGLRVDDIGQGDVVLIYTGWSEYYHNNTELFYDLFASPGIAKEVVTEIIFDTNAVIIGSDNWGIDAWILDPATNTTEIQGGHEIFITCGGGMLHENVDLKEWVIDARNGDSPWIGAYVYQPLPIQGSVASPGKLLYLFRAFASFWSKVTKIE